MPSTSASTSVASAFGRAIEGLVDIAYMRDRGVSSTDVYFDALSVGTYVRFLSRKHGIPESTLRARVTRVPDLLDTRTTFSRSGRGEFYEIKPNSPSGTRAGRDKLHDIDAYMALTPPLPYERGSTWSPGTISIPIPLTAILTALSVIPGLGSLAGQLARAFLFCGAPDVTLEVRRTEPGLLQYRLCVEADLACYAEYAIAEDVLIAIIAIIILAPEVIPELVAEGPEIIAELPELIEEVGEIAPELPADTGAPRAGSARHAPGAARTGARPRARRRLPKRVVDLRGGLDVAHRGRWRRRVSATCLTPSATQPPGSWRLIESGTYRLSVAMATRDIDSSRRREPLPGTCSG